VNGSFEHPLKPLHEADRSSVKFLIRLSINDNELIGAEQALAVDNRVGIIPRAPNRPEVIRDLLRDWNLIFPDSMACLAASVFECGSCVIAATKTTTVGMFGTDHLSDDRITLGMGTTQELLTDTTVHHVGRAVLLFDSDLFGFSLTPLAGHEMPPTMDGVVCPAGLSMNLT
jgi:hypothetical protein